MNTLSTSQISTVTVIFACVRNAGRSQMAAAYFNAIADPSKARAVSAGTRPARHVDPVVIVVMREVGVDLSAAVPQLLTPELVEDAAWLITMGCGEQCPVVPGVRRDDWPVDDPHDQAIDEARRIRDDVAQRVRALVDRQKWAAAAAKALY